RLHAHTVCALACRITAQKCRRPVMPAAKPGHDANGARDARRLSTLLEVSQSLSGTLNLKSALQRVLATLLRHHSVMRAMITMLRDDELQVEAVEGFE